MQAPNPSHQRSNPEQSTTDDHPLLFQTLKTLGQGAWLPTTSGILQPVVVGVSGGADSVCLLHLLARLADRLQITLHVAHLDHNLRPQSTQDADFVHRLADSLALPYHIHRLEKGSLQNHPQGLEAAARKTRYTFLADTAINVTPADQVPLVAVAHHAEDQAETLLLNLIRGAGLRGLRAMQWFSKREHPTRAWYLLRPFLHTSRTQLRDYLQSHHYTWCEDTSNEDLHFARNRIRHVVLPALRQINPGVVDTLGHTATILAAESDRIERLDENNFRALLEPQHSVLSPASSPIRLVFQLERWRQLELVERRGFLRQALRHLERIEKQREEEATQINFALIARLEEEWFQANQAISARPLIEGWVWSLLPANVNHPDLISLHQQNSVPIQPNHPLLYQAQDEKRILVGHDSGVTSPLSRQSRDLPKSGSHSDFSVEREQAEYALVIPGLLRFASGWVLHCEVMDKEEMPLDWKQKTDPWQAWLDAEASSTLYVTTLHPGMKFTPLGMKGKHKAIGDFFTDRKIPVALRALWPLLVDGQNKTNRNVLWVCGQSVDERARITDQTQRVLHLWWER